MGDLNKIGELWLNTQLRLKRISRRENILHNSKGSYTSYTFTSEKSYPTMQHFNLNTLSTLMLNMDCQFVSTFFVRLRRLPGFNYLVLIGAEEEHMLSLKTLVAHQKDELRIICLQNCCFT